MEPEKEWSKFKDIRIKYLRSARHRNKEYPVYLFRTSVDDNRERICGGMCLTVMGKKAIMVNDKIYQIATRDELKALIKHEILHDVLKHRNVVCSKERYIEKHKALYNLMSKKELINSLSLHLRSM